MRWQCIHPGTVGISFGAADRLLDALESCGTEPHALLVLRHGSPVFEGYWAPYAPGIIHGDQSLTKTVTGVALGVALTEGILHLDDRLIDLFPEFAHHAQGRPWWDQLRVRHIATMGAGMERQPAVTDPDWIEKFFQMDIVHEPGTAFYYNSIACSMVGACIRRRTGLGLMDYLTPRVFNKIGIDAEHLRWHKHPDGMENGSGGLISTVRDNALIMELYRRSGVWEGERILCPEWVDFALKVQNPHTDGATYGGMMWMYPDFMVADGAMGQWSMLFPQKDVVISIQQTIVGSTTCDNVREALTSFVDAISDSPQEWSDEETARFQRRLCTLSLPAPDYHENHAALHSLDGRRLVVAQGTARFFADDLMIFNNEYSTPIDAYSFAERNGDLLLTVEARGRAVTCPVGLRGYRPVCDVPAVSTNPARTASVTGTFLDAHTLALEIRWLETCRIHRLIFHFDAAGAAITTIRVPIGGFDVPEETARAQWQQGGINHAQKAERA